MKAFFKRHIPQSPIEGILAYEVVTSDYIHMTSHIDFIDVIWNLYEILSSNLYEIHLDYDADEVQPFIKFMLSNQETNPKTIQQRLSKK